MWFWRALAERISWRVSCPEKVAMVGDCWGEEVRKLGGILGGGLS